MPRSVCKITLSDPPVSGKVPLLVPMHVDMYISNLFIDPASAKVHPQYIYKNLKKCDMLTCAKNILHCETIETPYQLP